MATMHGHGKGKASSHSPKPEKPYWLKLDAKELEAVIIKLAKQDMTADRIGLILRDSYGIPNVKVITGKKISKIMEEHGIKSEPLDMTNLRKKEKKLRKHLEAKKQDKTAKKGLQLTQAKLHRLSKYYAKHKKL